RLAAPIPSVTSVPASIATPPSTASRTARRLPSWFGLWKRRNSSTAVVIKPGSARSRRCSPGCSSRLTTALAIRFVVVSWPALRRKMHWCRSSSSVRRSPASSAASSADRISAGSGLERGERPRRERRGEELPDARVVGRIAEDNARRVVLVERARAELRRELHTLVGAPRVVVLVDGDDVIVAREEVRAVRAAVHRVPAPQPVVVGERVVVEVVGQRAQVEGERRRALRLLGEDAGRRHSGAGSWGRSSSRASAYRSASART